MSASFGGPSSSSSSFSNLPFCGAWRANNSNELICWTVGMLLEGRPNKTPFTFLAYFMSPLKAAFQSLMIQVCLFIASDIMDLWIEGH